MTEPSKPAEEKKAFDIRRVMLLFVIVVAVGLVKALINGAFSTDRPESNIGLISYEELQINPDLEPVKVDLLRDGSIVVNGQLMSLDELEEKLPGWKESGYMLSFFNEPAPEDDSSTIHPGAQVCLRSGMMLSIRSEAQEVK